MSIDHTISEICYSKIEDVILIGDNITEKINAMLS